MSDDDLWVRARAAGMLVTPDGRDDRGGPVDPDAAVAVLEAMGDQPRVPGPLVAWDGNVDVDARRVVVAADDGSEQDYTRSSNAGAVAVGPLAPGVHSSVVHGESGSDERTIISAPRHAFGAPGVRWWGVLLPLYALRTARDRGVGDLADLRALGRFVARRSGHFAATLPILATGDDPSPYSPLSRRHWDHTYLDLDSLPEIAADAEAVDRIAAARARADARRVDWPGVRSDVRAVLERAVENLSARPRRRAELDRWLGEHRDVEDWARFCALHRRHGADLRVLPADEYSIGGDDPEVVLAAYAQWSMRTQLSDLATDLAERGSGLQLDLPVGVHPDGFDVWASPGLYATSAVVGAPPDAFFEGGQSWGFPPARPAASSAEVHWSLRRALSHHMSVAKILRIDHVMGLRRLFWIPDGFAPTQGIYVEYPAEELIACVTLASHEHGCMVVGEDLGTVPDSLRSDLAAHEILGTWVFQFESDMKPPRRCLATVDTHDLPTFAAHWNGLDIEARAQREEISEEMAVAQRGGRAQWRASVAEQLGLATDDAREALAAVLGALGRSDAEMVQVSLEDLWLETRPQNLPGSVDASRNWCHRSARRLEELSEPNDPADRLLYELGHARATPGRTDAREEVHP